MVAIFYSLRMADAIRINGQEVNKTITILRLLANVNGDSRKQSVVCLLFLFLNAIDIVCNVEN
jgi:hypothetical protein